MLLEFIKKALVSVATVCVIINLFVTLWLTELAYRFFITGFDECQFEFLVEVLSFTWCILAF